MTYSYTDKELHKLNQGENVYNINPDHAKNFLPNLVQCSQNLEIVV